MVMTASPKLPAARGQERGQLADKLSAVAEALAAFARGEPLLVVDDNDRCLQGSLVIAGARATPERLAFMVRHTSGVVCVALSDERVAALGLPPMVPFNESSQGTEFTISVDARIGTTTGISAHDRARTISLLSDQNATPEDFVRPGHVFPVRAATGGVLVRQGLPEAATDLTLLAGLPPVAAMCEVVDAHGNIAGSQDLQDFAALHSIPTILVSDLAIYRRIREAPTEAVPEANIPTAFGNFRARTFPDPHSGGEHLALSLGEVEGGSGVPLVIHSECVVGDVFRSRDCGCRTQLDEALQYFAQVGQGIVVYLRGGGIASAARRESVSQPGSLTPSGLSLTEDLATDALEASVVAAHILRAAGVLSVRLLAADPAMAFWLAELGIEVVGMGSQDTGGPTSAA
jgi:3,4-dihydroxy 2-butanone 4-phosphate synthase / GTP cyclohydrolase II